MPIVYAPVLPMIRMGLKNHPHRDKIFLSCVGVALVHGVYCLVNVLPSGGSTI